MSSQSQVESDLARLKAELGPGTETPAIEAGGDEAEEAKPAANAAPAAKAEPAAEEQKQ
jgi:hypothetical protein